MKKKILIGLLVFATVVGLAFAAKTYKCRVCGKNTVYSQNDICETCLKEQTCNYLNKEEKKAANEGEYDAAKSYQSSQKNLGCGDDAE